MYQIINLKTLFFRIFSINRLSYTLIEIERWQEILDRSRLKVCGESCTSPSLANSRHHTTSDCRPGPRRGTSPLFSILLSCPTHPGPPLRTESSFSDYSPPVWRYRRCDPTRLHPKSPSQIVVPDTIRFWTLSSVRRWPSNSSTAPR